MPLGAVYHTLPQNHAFRASGGAVPSHRLIKLRLLSADWC